VASTLHQLTESMCRYFAQYDVKLSTSIDGPAWLHNRNRPTHTRDAFERTVAGIALARENLGQDSVSALMTTTRLSLGHPEEIVDAYVALGLHELFLRPLSSYGFARRNQALLGYTTDQFMAFYRRALDRVLMWNARGTEIREVYAGLILNKLISTFDAGYVDLQSPNASGQAVLVYNYDGFIYPSDEARMLAESGDTSFRMGEIGTPQDALDASPAMQRIRRDGSADQDADCVRCAFRHFCAPSPVDAASAVAFKPGISTRETDHCRRQTAMFDEMLSRLATAGELSAPSDTLRQWAAPLGLGGA
jgi:His-Xaa-Ser system radical SAM maturase HxsB